MRYTRLIVINSHNYAQQETFRDHDPRFIKTLEVLTNWLTFVFVDLTEDENVETRGMIRSDACLSISKSSPTKSDSSFSIWYYLRRWRGCFSVVVCQNIFI
jgi:hypothetical protein